ncbi:MAG: hypothetical protein IPK04_08365 [Bdellovibrionales bacterium]|nr:hypothetical protein [Bdellovibrionales bacterium]
MPLLLLLALIVILTFKALGDSTRFAIASILARSPTNSVELQRKRGVLEKLSELTIAKLFDTNVPMSLMRTRGGSAP